MNETPSSERLHIAFFGRRNAGKSSLLNAVTGQDLAIVSEVKGTTTDPVLKSMELLPLGPVVVIDTPGLDDEGELGQLRIRKTRQMLNKTDLAVLVVDSTVGLQQEEKDILELIRSKNIPHVVALNKADAVTAVPAVPGERTVAVSALKGTGIRELKDLLGKSIPQGVEKRILADLIQPKDLVVMVTPIDAAAPKGRLILPQQQTLREILDCGAIAVVTKDTELKDTLQSLGKAPSLVVTDSQAFGFVSKVVPENLPLTSFSILFSRYKGYLDGAVKGARKLDDLHPGDRILIGEGCTHHRQCGDIGTDKLPKLICKHAGCELNFEFTSGTGFPDDLSGYDLIVHCGGCMLNEREMRYRAKCAADAGIPMTNYGIAIAHINGILKRSIQPLPGFEDWK